MDSEIAEMEDLNIVRGYF